MSAVPHQGYAWGSIFENAVLVVFPNLQIGRQIEALLVLLIHSLDCLVPPAREGSGIRLWSLSLEANYLEYIEPYFHYNHIGGQQMVDSFTRLLSEWAR